MKEDTVTNKICVRLCDEDGNYKVSYYTSNLQETLAMYQYMSDHEIELMYKNNSEDEHEKSCFIESIDVGFGNNDNLLSINLYCSIVEL